MAPPAAARARRDKSVRPVWPSGVAPFLIIAAFASGFAVAFWPAARVGPLLHLYRLGLVLFRSQKGLQVVMGAAGLVHVFEAAACAAMCARRGCALQHTCGWVLITLLLGYFGIHTFKACSARPRH